jgi:hypothetical protein
MAAGDRFPRATCVFVDGDQEAKVGCSALPGNDSPERVVFGSLEQKNWASLHTRINRGFSEVADACKQATTYTNHHEWVRLAADRLLLSGLVLWQAMCSEWAGNCLSADDADTVIAPIEKALIAFAQNPKRARQCQ